MSDLWKIDYSEAELRVLATMHEDKWRKHYLGHFGFDSGNEPSRSVVTTNMVGSNGTVVIDDMYELMDNLPKRKFSYPEEYHLGPQLRRQLSPTGRAAPLRQMSFGEVPIYESNQFPYNHQCGTCGGSGEGQSSTYCKPCGGAGERCVEGMAKSDGTYILITRPLPKKFQPSFPKGIVPAQPMCRGL